MPQVLDGCTAKLDRAHEHLDGARSLLLVTTCVAAAAAFVRDSVEHGTVSGALAVAGNEATAVVGCFLVLGPVLGLRHR